LSTLSWTDTGQPIHENTPFALHKERKMMERNRHEEDRREEEEQQHSALEEEKRSREGALVKET
jgi:hypothetical protein